MTPIRQQNPPGPLKLLGLREKTSKNTDFLILLKKTDFLVAHFVTLCSIGFSLPVFGVIRSYGNSRAVITFLVYYGSIHPPQGWASVPTDAARLDASIGVFFVRFGALRGV